MFFLLETSTVTPLFLSRNSDMPFSPTSATLDSPRSFIIQQSADDMVSPKVRRQVGPPSPRLGRSVLVASGSHPGLIPIVTCRLIPNPEITACRGIVFFFQRASCTITDRSDGDPPTSCFDNRTRPTSVAPSGITSPLPTRTGPSRRKRTSSPTCSFSTFKPFLRVTGICKSPGAISGELYLSCAESASANSKVQSGTPNVRIPHPEVQSVRSLLQK